LDCALACRRHQANFIFILIGRCQNIAFFGKRRPEANKSCANSARASFVLPHSETSLSSGSPSGGAGIIESPHH
jgi:hypothetical protein